MNSSNYVNKQQEDYLRYEGLCKKCGACCGAFDDPCVNLKKDSNNKFYCKVYNNRFGSQKTVSGKFFNCVPIRDVLKFEPLYPDCVYAKNL
ncbi:MAG: hypothetical protein P9L96_05210 [Candidatus Gygaella obscura]|nr:hypothetical protein [Candidatus Gygaella obscura]